MPRIVDEPSLVLHTRPYRDSSLIISLLTPHHGRVSLVARGARGSRRGRSLQPFSLLRVGWSGRTALGTLNGYDVIKQHWLKGRELASAFYLCELVTRLLGERESHPRVFAALVWAFEHLTDDLELVLRSFEKRLLEDIGYGLDFYRDVQGVHLQPDETYVLEVDQGFRISPGGIPGSALLAIGSDDFSRTEVRRAAKRIFREALAAHLGPAPLNSRRLLADT